MKRKLVLVLSIVIAVVFCSAGAYAGQKYRVINKIHAQGAEGWDYLCVDSAAHRLYVSRGTHVIVADTAGNTVVGEIPGTDGVHGIALAPEFNLGFTSNGKANTSTIFDLKTLEKKGEVQTGENPDAILYDGFSKKVFTFNGKSKDATIIDAAAGKVTGTIALGGKPEYACSDGKGMIYVNIEDTAEVAEIDAVKAVVTRRFSIKPGEEPTGIAMDVKDGLIFSGCRNKMMMVTDVKLGKLIAGIPVGEGVDGCGFDPGLSLAFCANGKDGTMTVIKVPGNGKFTVVQTVKTQKGARTLAVDEAAHKIYLPTAEFGPMPDAAPEKGKWQRPPVIDGTFVVLVVGR